MSQVGNSVGGDSFLPVPPPVAPKTGSPPPDVTGDYLTITLSDEEIAKVMAFRKRSEGHPRVSNKDFFALIDRLVMELEGKS